MTRFIKNGSEQRPMISIISHLFVYFNDSIIAWNRVVTRRDAKITPVTLSTPAAAPRENIHGESSRVGERSDTYRGLGVFAALL